MSKYNKGDIVQINPDMEIPKQWAKSNIKPGVPYRIKLADETGGYTILVPASGKEEDKFVNHSADASIHEKWLMFDPGYLEEQFKKVFG